MEDSAATFVATFRDAFPEYQESYRSGGKLAGGREELAINFDVTSEGQAVRGQFYFLQTGTTVCAITYARPAPANAEFVDVPDPLVSALELRQP